MATVPVQFFPSPMTQQRPSYKIWLPVLFGLMVICFESTPEMGGSTTGKWLTEFWPRMLAKWEPATFGLVHHLLRKLGHLTGYGTLGLLLRRAWHSSMRMYLKLMGSRLIFASSTLSVLFTFVVGCLDEWHQSVLPGRSSSFRDVLIDTSGAILFNVIFWTVRLVRRKSLLRKQADFRRSTLLVSGI